MSILDMWHVGYPRDIHTEPSSAHWLSRLCETGVYRSSLGYRYTHKSFMGASLVSILTGQEEVHNSRSTPEDWG